jgi:hypothetical protein
MTTDPLPPEIGIPPPSAATADGAEIVMVDDVFGVAEEMVNTAVATVPLGTVLALKPIIMQFPPLH